MFFSDSRKLVFIGGSVMWLIWSLFIGLIVGLIAKMLTPGRDPGGFLVTSLIGIAGALVAGYLGQALGWYLPGEPAGFLASVVGAILILLVVRMVRKN